MTTNGENSTLQMPCAYEAERRRLVLARVRAVAMAALAPLGLAVPLHVWAFPETVAAPPALLAAVALVCVAGLLLARTRVAAAHPDALAVAFVLAMALCTARLVLQSAEDLDVLAGVVVASLLTATLVFPWPGWAQAVVAVAIGAGYAWLLAGGGYGAGRLANVLVALVDGVALSIVGAFVLDRQRRTAFQEREQAAALAAQREQLLEVGHELNDVLEAGELSQRIVRRGRLLVGADSCALVLADAANGTVRTAALDGELPPSLRAILDREATGSVDQPFFQELRRHAWVEIPGSGGPLDALAPELRHAYGIHRLLLVPVHRDGDFLGYLAFLQLAEAPAFTAAQQRLAAGLAQLSAVALANARLVAALQRADRVKNEFVSTMSHELRTPLGVIMGYTEILEDGDASLRLDAIVRIKRASAELLEMIQETLDLNRLESGRDAPVIAPIGVRAFWDELRSELGALPRAPGVALRFEPAPDAVIASDRRKLRIVVKNLVANALKFTAAGEIVATCAVEPGGCAITVRDTGIGIASGDLPVIFEMFRQADSSDRRAYGGVGLGLHIVQRFVAQLGGVVHVSSTPGAGSTFRVELPGSRIVTSATAAA